MSKEIMRGSSVFSPSTLGDLGLGKSKEEQPTQRKPIERGSIVIAGTAGNKAALSEGYMALESERANILSSLGNMVYGSLDNAKSKEFADLMGRLQQVDMRLNEIHMLQGPSKEIDEFALQRKDDIIEDRAENQIALTKLPDGSYSMDIMAYLTGGAYTVGDKWIEAYNTPTIGQGPLGYYQVNMPDLPNHYKQGALHGFFLKSSAEVRQLKKERDIGLNPLNVNINNVLQTYMRTGTVADNYDAVANFAQNVYNMMDEDAKKELTEQSIQNIMTNINYVVARNEGKSPETGFVMLDEGFRLFKDITADVNRSNMTAEEKAGVIEQQNILRNQEESFYKSVVRLTELRTQLANDKKNGIERTPEQLKKINEEIQTLVHAIERGHDMLVRREMENIVEVEIDKMRITESNISTAKVATGNINYGGFGFDGEGMIDDAVNPDVSSLTDKMNILVNVLGSDGKPTGLKTVTMPGLTLNPLEYDLSKFQLSGSRMLMNKEGKYQPNHIIIPSMARTVFLTNDNVAKIFRPVSLTGRVLAYMPKYNNNIISGIPGATILEAYFEHGKDLLEGLRNYQKMYPNATVADLTGYMKRMYAKYARSVGITSQQRIDKDFEQFTNNNLNMFIGGTPTNPIVKSFKEVQESMTPTDIHNVVTVRVYRDDILTLNDDEQAMAQKILLNMKGVRKSGFRVKEIDYATGKEDEGWRDRVLWKKETIDNNTEKYIQFDILVPYQVFQGVRKNTIGSQHDIQRARINYNLMMQKRAVNDISF